MSNIDKRALREAANAANAASWGNWESYKPHKGARGYEVKVGVKAVAQHCLKVDSVFIAAANPATVLGLLDEIAELEQRHCGTALLEREEMHTKTLGRMLDELDAKDRRIAELELKLEAAEKRIAELEALARGVKQYSEFQICHYGATEDYAKGYIDCQNNYNKVLFSEAGKGE
ncbi:TPA: ead/Ea22-like family protein [Citrobacter freundii]|nr:ead/Ea22-like family protein [Citrobacter freundii]